MATRLKQEEAQAEKLAWACAKAAERYEAHVRELAHQNEMGQQATPEQYNELGRDLGRYRDLEQDLDRIEAKVRATTKALARSESNERTLSRDLAQAQAQWAREREWWRARKSKATAVVRSLWQLLQARRGLRDGLARNLYLGMRVVGLVVWMLPTADRDRWRQEAYRELEELKQEDAPLLGDAIRIALRVPWLASVLWTDAWGRSPTGRWLAGLEPLWIGLATAAATFSAGLAGIGQSPTDRQMRLLKAASLLAGVLAAWPAHKRRRPRRRRRKRW